MQGLRGTARSAVRVIPGAALRPLPPITEQRSALTQIAENIAVDAAEDVEHGREFDVFISHASEDKERIVRPLAHALQERDLKVWSTSSSFESVTASAEGSTAAFPAVGSGSSFCPTPSSRRTGPSTNWTD
jgi:hypothetical protein